MKRPVIISETDRIAAYYLDDVNMRAWIDHRSEAEWQAIDRRVPLLSCHAAFHTDTGFVEVSYERTAQ